MAAVTTQVVRTDTASRVATVLAAGAAGSLTMGASILAARRLLPRHERYALPPIEIAAITLRRMTRRRVPLRTIRRWGIGGHIAYGALTALPLLAFPAPDRARTGVLLGIAVWAGSYLGWLPAARILTPATRHPVRRTTVMIVGHLIWGITAARMLRILGR